MSIQEQIVCKRRRCGRPVKPGSTQCLKCLEQHRNCTNRRREKRLQVGLCARCGKEPHKPGIERCKNCLTGEVQKHRNRKFGISAEEYDALLKMQGGSCAICHTPPTRHSLSVDHDHHSNKIRGLLCHRCNLGIGYFKDHITLLMQAINYLSNPRG